MSYLNRVWMAASVAVVSGHSDQGHKWKSGLQSLQHGKADLRPISGMLDSNIDGFGSGEERKKKTDESLRQVMYLNCWGQS